MLLAQLAEEVDHGLPCALARLGIGGPDEQRLECGLVVAVAECGRELLVLDGVGDRRLRQLVDEGVDRRTRAGADELGDDLAVPERLDRRDPGDAVPARQLLVRVDVDLREGHVAPADRLLEDRGELFARPAPLRPEVDEDGLAFRPLDHVRLECALGDVHQVLQRSRRQSRSRRVAAHGAC